MLFKKQLCRLCLGQTPTAFSILEQETQMLEALTSIKVSSTDGLSNVICIKCRLNLKLAYNFQQRIIEANKNISHNQSFAKSDEMIKEERVENDCISDVFQMSNDVCFICGLSTDLINSHLEKHFQEEQHCDLCEKMFPNVQSYRKHLDGHPFADLYHCTKCAFSFQYKSFYERHIENFHKETPVKNCETKSKAEPKTFTCTLCSKVNNSKSGHMHHMMNHQTKTCPVCDKAMAAGSLRQHMEIHSDNPQMCEICGSTLKNKSSLRVHLRYSHKKERFPCEECGKIFKKKMTLNQHKNTHGAPKYVCETCGKKFFSQHRLNVHTRMTHMKLRPHNCEYCKKAFSSKFALTTHKRQHTNETPYRCEICGEGFRQNVSLKGHKKSKHNIEEPKTCECDVCGKGFASEWALKSHYRTH